MKTLLTLLLLIPFFSYSNENVITKQKMSWADMIEDEERNMDNKRSWASVV